MTRVITADEVLAYMDARAGVLWARSATDVRLAVEGIREAAPPSPDLGEGLREPQMVWCVLCIEPPGGDVTHIFSSKEKAEAFADSDSRQHILYDYVLDETQRMEEQGQ